MTRTVRAPAWSLPAPVRTGITALGVQSALALLYLTLTDAGLAAPRTLAVPVVWVTVAVVAVRHAERPAVGRSGAIVSGAIGVAYAVGLAWLTGALGPAMGVPTGLDVVLLPPGWGPVVRYRGAELAVSLLPYRAVGVAALGYLVSLSARDVIGNGLSAGIGGVVALGSCASCALPLVTSAVGALGGAGIGLGAVPSVAGGTYLFGTLAYVLAAWVLAARPLDRYTTR
ncbi:hypothetical protein JCM30237_21990 [Halolamina litorea]|uniref:Uncharacterized protein n=1 Tax=Halolamina litorea TaxID=1515593 RepID=A0ABD6BQE9_9EURY|nr:hypothetical protein [Halolamina litorea]